MRTGWLALLVSLQLVAPALAERPALAWQVTAPPAERKLPEFYQKCVEVHGFPIVASEHVSDYALLEAAYLIENMAGSRRDILQALAENNVRFAIMGVKELTTQIPEHSDLEPRMYWDRRARGLGPTSIRPAVSCGEENLLRLKGDPYSTESILVHEFAHAIHLMGLNTIDETFDTRLRAVYDRAMEKELWKDKYAASNYCEYWAEGVQCWFDTNRPPDHDHNHVNTRELLVEYDPELAKLIEEVFGASPWRYQHPHERLDRGHLVGCQPHDMPTFAWPAELDAAYKKAYPNPVAARHLKQEKP